MPNQSKKTKLVGFQDIKIGETFRLPYGEPTDYVKIDDYYAYFATDRCIHRFPPEEVCNCVDIRSGKILGFSPDIEVIRTRLKITKR